MLVCVYSVREGVGYAYGPALATLPRRRPSLAPPALPPNPPQNDSLATLLARLEGILGPLPSSMISGGRYSHRWARGAPRCFGASVLGTECPGVWQPCDF